MNHRDKLQEKWANEFINYKLPGILHLCPRSGKIRTCIRIFCKIQRLFGYKPAILICYPDKNIQQSWEDDIAIVNYNNPNIEYVTHISLAKKENNYYDIIVCDEIHLLSSKQKENFKRIMNRNSSSSIVGLTGTLSSQTEQELVNELKMPVINSYTLAEAINDGIISDYRIKVIKVDLDDTKKLYKKIGKIYTRTEKTQYKALSWVIENRGPNLFLNLARMRIIHNSIAKSKKTRDILTKLSSERVLVFCANNKIAKSLGCKVHTSKFNSQEQFEKFISGTGTHYAVCKIGNTGVSFKDLDNIVINAFDSNSENLTQRICRSLILDEKDKISNIYIISSTEKAELRWLEKSLEFFDKSKIKYG